MLRIISGRRLIITGRLAFVIVLISTLFIVPSTMTQVRSAVATSATSAAVAIPSMKLPWDKSLTNIPLTGGPHSGNSQVSCVLEPISSMSGVDFGLATGTNVLAVAGGTVFLAGPVSDSRGPYIVGIDHGRNFATEYWHLSLIDPTIKVGVSVAQGRLLAKSGAPVGGVAHLHLEFRTGSPDYLTPFSAHGMSINGYRIWTYVNTSTGKGYNYEGTMTRGTTTNQKISACNATGVKTWHSKSGSTIVADVNGTGGYLTSTNSVTYFDDLSSYTPDQPPASYLLRGASGAAPIIEEVGGTGPAFRLLGFPQISNQYWDSWALKDGLTLHAPYVVTVKLNFQTSGDRGGLTIAWNDTNWDRIDIQPNIFWQNIEFRITYTGPIPSSPVVTGPGLARGSVPMQVGTNYWLRVAATGKVPGQGKVIVYWSMDGTHFTSIVTATGLADLSGLAGMGTAGPNLPHVYFDDFQAK